MRRCAFRRCIILKVLVRGCVSSPAPATEKVNSEKGSMGLSATHHALLQSVDAKIDLGLNGMNTQHTELRNELKAVREELAASYFCIKILMFAVGWICVGIGVCIYFLLMVREPIVKAKEKLNQTTVSATAAVLPAKKAAIEVVNRFRTAKNNVLQSSKGYEAERSNDGSN